MTHIMKLHPWDEALAGAERQVALGRDVFQQFNCEHCGQKLTMEIPNEFHETGTCDKCGKLTNIKANGMNYMLRAKIKI